MESITKYMNYGYKNLDEEEIIELFLYLSGYKNPEKKKKELLSYYGSYNNILRDSNNKNKKLNNRFLILTNLVREVSESYIYDKMKEDDNLLKNSSLVVEFFRRKIGHENEEAFYILMLNNANKYITHRKISKGTIDKAFVFIREIIKQIVDCNVKNIIICHNHPSGDCMPSNEDKRVTQNIEKALSMFEVSLLDHIIVSSNSYYSFAERGLI